MGFTYYAANLLTNQIIAELPLIVDSFRSSLKQNGDLGGYVSLADRTAKEKMDILAGTAPDITSLYVDYNGELVWGGIIWSRRYTGEDKKLEIQATEFGSFYERQDILEDLFFGQVDQLDIARALIVYVEDQFGGGIGMGLDPSMTSGVLRDRTYNGYDAKNVYEAIDQLSNVIDGFDYAFEVFWDDSQAPSKRFVLSYPHRGRSYQDTNNVLDFPGAILKYVWTEDGSATATRSVALGQGQGDTGLVSVAQDAERLINGWPLLQNVVSYSDVIEQSTLDEHSAADLKAFKQPLETPQVLMRVDGPVGLKDLLVGDEFVLTIEDDRFPEGISEVFRLVGWTCHPEAMDVDLEIGTVEIVGITPPASLPSPVTTTISPLTHWDGDDWIVRTN